jgi:tetratricopeptide (TPR) repeat protein
LVEARVRLGRIFQLERRLADARRELKQAGAESSVSFLAYLSALFLGQVEDQEGHYDAAIECYQAALRRYPDAQAASLGLGHALEMKGDLDGAWSVVRQSLGSGNASDEPAPDPWSVYQFAQYWQIEKRLEDLRKAVRQ